MNKQKNIKKQLKLTKRDSSLIRQLLKIPKAEPLKKSSSMNQLNAIHQLVLETIQNTIQTQGPINKQMWLNQLRVLDFDKYHKHNAKPLYRTCNRYFNHERHLAFLDSLSHIITIQTNYRSYSSKKDFCFKAKDYIEAKGINAIFVIQSKVRQFILLKKLKLHLLIGSILAQRRKNFRKIEENMQRFYIHNRTNTQLIYEDIVRKRTRSAIKLESVFRQRVVYLKLLGFKEQIKNHYYLLYPFKAEEISLKIFAYGNDEAPDFKVFLYHFIYDSFLKSFVLFVPFDAFPSGKYRCQFIVDKIETCDGRYPHIEFTDGQFYNMIDFRRPNEANINEKINSNAYIPDLDETSPEEMREVEVVLANLSNKCYYEEIKNYQTNYDILSLRIDLHGKQFNSKMEEIRTEPFSKIELKFNN